ncbi:uncharacterized protein LY79DRAFT_6359 [Colletotrichum navitas]|uniref:Uncharacterized protein n=1 Tax=Colletotrichum navitas TaxID=681940 RepID=A0AAD8QD89_9PEZI|nr:uncharacterized protein LY79DRAFT_6359 [Colletotrichum navitas]KAK1600099.1 hypothetical protein LY79DRAFT_6359 [Colletotrichum navitas]
MSAMPVQFGRNMALPGPSPLVQGLAWCKVRNPGKGLCLWLMAASAARLDSRHGRGCKNSRVCVRSLRYFPYSGEMPTRGIIGTAATRARIWQPRKLVESLDAELGAKSTPSRWHDHRVLGTWHGAHAVFSCHVSVYDHVYLCGLTRDRPGCVFQFEGYDTGQRFQRELHQPSAKTV